MDRKLRIFPTLFVLGVTLFAHGVGEAGTISADRLKVTDVTPLAFSVIWATSKPATCGLNVFLDAEGTAPYLEAAISPESSEHPPAEDTGVMKIRVVNLKPNTRYFFQTKTTFKNDGTVYLYPEGPPFIEVRTEESSIIVRNDMLTQQVIVPDGKSALGTLLIAHVGNASYPISGWTGDGVPDEWAAIDTNNFYDKEKHFNLELEGGEIINLTLFAGCLSFVETQDTVPEETGGIQQLKVKAILPDSDCLTVRPKVKVLPWIIFLLLDALENENETPGTLQEKAN